LGDPPLAAPSGPEHHHGRRDPRRRSGADRRPGGVHRASRALVDAHRRHRERDYAPPEPRPRAVQDRREPLGRDVAAARADALPALQAPARRSRGAPPRRRTSDPHRAGVGGPRLPAVQAHRLHGADSGRRSADAVRCAPRRHRTRRDRTRDPRRDARRRLSDDARAGAAARREGHHVDRGDQPRPRGRRRRRPRPHAPARPRGRRRTDHADAGEAPARAGEVRGAGSRQRRARRGDRVARAAGPRADRPAPAGDGRLRGNRAPAPRLFVEHDADPRHHLGGRPGRGAPRPAARRRRLHRQALRSGGAALARAGGVPAAEGRGGIDDTHAMKASRRVTIAMAAAAALTASATAVAQTRGDLAGAAIEDLMNIEITSAARKEQPANAVPAAVYVITSDAIRRSGLTTVPELLRLAPGVDVAQINSNSWAVTIRGFNDRWANKLLVLIDGRSIYTRTYAGVDWSMQDLPVDDIDRIEVIRGPAASTWGANAVNGVINVITKSAADTQGTFVSLGSGRIDQGSAAARYGGATDHASYRAYAQWTDGSAFVDAGHQSTGDTWSRFSTGFRSDWTRGADSVTAEATLVAGRAWPLWTSYVGPTPS